MMKCIEIPNPAIMDSIADLAQAKKKLEERQKKLAYQVSESSVELIEFLTKKIIENSEKGCKFLKIDVADSNFDKNHLDPRIDFYFEGPFWKGISTVEKVFIKSGYKIKIKHLACTNNNAYRSGIIWIYW